LELKETLKGCLRIIDQVRKDMIYDDVAVEDKDISDI